MSEQLILPEQAVGDLLAAAAFIAQHIKNSEGHAEAMQSVVPRFIARGEVDLAAELANTVEDPFTRDRLLIQAAEKCAEVGDDDYGLQLADAIEDVGMRSQARERIAIRKAAAGEFETAADLADDLLNADYVHAEIAAGLAKAGRETDAVEELRKIEMPVVRAGAFQAIAAADREEGKSEPAIASLDQALSAAKEIEQGEERVRTLGEIANAFFEAGQKDRSVEAYESAREEAHQLRSLHRDAFLAGIAIGIARAGDIERADEALDMINDPTHMASGLLGFARIFWDAEDKDEAMETLEEAYSIARSQREDDVRDSRAANNLMGLIATQYAVFEKTDRAIEIAQENHDDNERMEALARIAQVATRGKNDDAARSAVRAIESEASRAFPLIGVARVHAELSDNEQAISFLEEAVDLVADLPQLLLRVSAFEAAAPLFAECDARGRSVEVCQKALETIALIKSDSERTQPLASLSDVYEQIGEHPGTSENEIVNAIIRKTLW